MPTVTDEPRRTRGVSRRTVVRGAAWTAPVIATTLAAPAFAASCTSLYSGTMDYGQTAGSTYSRASATSGSGTVTMSGPAGTVNVTVGSVFTGYTAFTSTPQNLDTLATVGGTGNTGLSFTQVANSNLVTGPLSTNGQTITIGFNRPVYNLSFLLTDLDYNANQYHDAIAMTTTGFTYSIPGGSTVTGAGTAANPWRTSGTAAFDNSTGNGGNVLVSYAGPISSFSLRYWNYLTLPSATPLQQGTWMAPMSFQTFNAGC